MIFPDKEKYMDDSRAFNVIPVFKTVPADFETPLSIFMKTKAAFLLESIERGENVGRYSIVGLGKKYVMRLNGKAIEIVEKKHDGEVKTRLEAANPLEEVRRRFREWRTPDYEGLPPFYGGAIGFLGYEAIRYFEDIPVAEEAEGIPDGLLVVPEIILAYDSVKRSLYIIASTWPGTSPEREYEKAVQRIEETSALLSKPLAFDEKPAGRGNAPLKSGTEREEFLKSVVRCKDHIVEGDIIQVVLSQKFFIETDVPPFAIYQKLRAINPSPYLFFLDFDDFYLIGSSPEVMVKCQNKELLVKPIAGTRKRGKSVAEDHQLARELLEDAKEKSEHIMLVDLTRNDLGRVAKPGSVEVTDFMNIEKFSHVMHIVSTVKAELDDAYDVFDVIKATFPAGTVSGAPKIRAMEIIAERERERRGPYAGMIFYLGFNGNLDSCITIRTILLKDGRATVQAGAGIVADSIPEREYEETVNKARALIQAIEAAGQGGSRDLAD